MNDQTPSNTKYYYDSFGMKIEATLPLLTRIIFAQIASCRCMTKTPDPDYHKEDCTYRVLYEAQKEIQKLQETLKKISLGEYLNEVVK